MGAPVTYTNAVHSVAAPVTYTNAVHSVAAPVTYTNNMAYAAKPVMTYNAYNTVAAGHHAVALPPSDTLTPPMSDSASTTWAPRSNARSSSPSQRTVTNTSYQLGGSQLLFVPQGGLRSLKYLFYFQ